MPDRTSRPQMLWAGLSSSGIQATKHPENQGIPDFLKRVFHQIDHQPLGYDAEEDEAFYIKDTDRP